MKKQMMMALLAASMTLTSAGVFAAEEAATEAEEVVVEAAEAAEEAAAKYELVELGDRPAYKALDYVEIGVYKDLPVEVDEILIAEETIYEAIMNDAATAGLYDTMTEGTVQNGDIANIDYEGKKDDVAFDGGTSQGYDLTIGSDTFIDGFEAGLVGVAIGDTVDLNLTFPEYYGNADLAGADVVFTVTVNSVQRMPEVTDALVNDLSTGAYSTVDAYKDYVKERLTKEAEQAQEDQIANDLMTQLYNLFTINEYPQELLDYSIAEMNNYYISYAQAYGMEFEDFINAYFGMDAATYDAQAAEVVKVSLEQELILMAVAESEKLNELTEEEFKAGADEYAARLGYENGDALIAEYGENKVRVSLAMDKAMDFVREQAIVSVIPAETEAVTEAMTE